MINTMDIRAVNTNVTSNTASNNAGNNMSNSKKKKSKKKRKRSSELSAGKKKRKISGDTSSFINISRDLPLDEKKRILSTVKKALGFEDQVPSNIHLEQQEDLKKKYEILLEENKNLRDGIINSLRKIDTCISKL
eukprot:TRINITY_DN3298_c0_g1_i2.p1 TRINITY_DN3298_c0_g1~~TRINITY_DN3298_c0_g1_i2.p1  ORF type:complete len:135 (+),score=41.29 TRINITY_DN3298_c0_g1_i2:889-1293(+)